ncbi:outer membrane protein [Helicobacter labacensis]|uniref:outer membrane protein n=1 Tax=Helicobacter labacensis TaxID=2316079 RepID=UPI0013CDF8A1|nr:outer membrane protein [Helicobacter labacensis]
MTKKGYYATLTSHKPQATSHKPQALSFKSSLLALSALGLFSLAPLSAEENGAFIEAGFQYSNFTQTQKVSKPVLEQVLGKSPPYNGNLFGADIQIGYKQFFGAKKRFGLRYYGFFSGQGGSYYNTMGRFSQPSANLFYGVGMDALLNFYEKKDRTFGMFVGVMIGGSSWLMGKAYDQGQCVYSNDDGQCMSMNNYYSDRARDFNSEEGFQAKFSPTFVQFLVNIGFRANFTKHQGFELGVRIPTINDPYLTITRTQDYEEYGVKKGDFISFNLRRNIAIFANYVYNF